MSSAFQAKIAKLPKWAQDAILALDIERGRLLLTLAQFNGEADSPVELLDGLEKRPLPNQGIRFYFGKEWIGARIRGPHLYIDASERLSIQPVASNAIEIRVDEGRGGER